jgi:hypothetical protein
MAYYIFLKSLRSLEEFRKNPHAKIPHKSLSINFQSLGKFKNLIFIRKIIFFRFRPSWPSGQSARPASQPSQPLAFSPADRTHARPIPACAAVAYWPKYVSLFTLAQPGDDAFSLCHRQVGPTCQFHLLPRAGRSRPRRRFSRPPHTTPPLPRDAEPSN